MFSWEIGQVRNKDTLTLWICEFSPDQVVIEDSCLSSQALALPQQTSECLGKKRQTNNKMEFCKMQNTFVFENFKLYIHSQWIARTVNAYMEASL